MNWIYIEKQETSGAMETITSAPSKIRMPLIAVLVGVAFYFGAKHGLLLSTPPDYIATFWPPNTVMLTALLLTDRRRWWIFFLAMTPAYLAAALQGGYSVSRTIIFFAANCTEILVAAFALKHIFGNRLKFDRLREMALFLLWAVLIASVVSAFIASITTFTEPDVNYWLAWRVWFLGDALGHLTLTPVIILWISSGLGWAKEVSLTRLIEGLGLALCLLIVGYFPLGAEIGASGNFPALLYTPLPVLLWAAIRFGPRGICSAVFVITLLAIWHAINGRGPFTANIPADNVLSLQLFLMAVSVPTMLLGSLLSERKQAAEALKESEDRYRVLVERSVDVVWRMNPNGVIMFISPSVKTLSGYEPEEMTGKPFSAFAEMFMTEDSSRDAAGSLKHYLKGKFGSEPISYELGFKRKDGTQLVAEIRSAPLLSPIGEIEAIQGIARDVTERKQAEKVLTEAEERFRQLADAGDDAIFITRKGVILEVNKQAQKMFGVGRDALVGTEVINIVAPTFRDFVAYQIVHHEVSFFELEALRSDGSTFPADGRLRETVYQGSAAWIVIVRDITGKKIAERKNAELQNELLQMQKMVAVGELAGGIAHDFNNILTGIYGFAQLAQHQIPKENPAFKNIQGIISASNRAVDLVNQILSFSRKSDKHNLPIHLQSLISDTLKFLRPTLPTTIDLREEIRVSSGQVFADPTQMHQVLLNLCTNAATAMQAEGGILELILDEIEIDGSTAKTHPTLHAGTYVKLVVRDNGVGIESANLEHVFEPFFTTKPPGKGTGLGLAVVHTIITDNDGTITVESVVGEGTTFTILLPRHRGVLHDTPLAKSQISHLGGEEILLVDDEEIVTHVNKKLLELQGYQVTVTNSSLDALGIFYSNPDQFDLVITDQTMPDMTGDELSKEILRLRPQMPIIICTGFSKKIDESTALALGVRRFLIKPIKIEVLGETIRSIFDES